MVCYRSKKHYDYLAGYNLPGHYLSLRNILEIGPFDRAMRIVFGIPSEKDGNSRRGSRRKDVMGIVAEIVGPVHDRFAKTIQFGYSADEIIPEIIEFRPKLLVGNPSYLRILADAISRRGITYSDILSNGTNHIIVFDVANAPEVVYISRESNIWEFVAGQPDEPRSDGSEVGPDRRRWTSDTTQGVGLSEALELPIQKCQRTIVYVGDRVRC